MSSVLPLAHRVSPPVAHFRAEAPSPSGFAYLGCHGESAHARELQSFITQAAHQVHPVLLMGEAGLRQEELARALHQASAQARQPFIAINAHALSEEALHLLLFGETTRPGILQSLSRGTVFVNELMRLSPRLHQRLAVYLEERHWLRDEAAEQRLILAADVMASPSATESRVAQGLLELLRPYRVALRPLRERRVDLPALASELLRRLLEQANRRALTLSPKALEALTEYDWPENLEELAGVLRAALAQVPPQQVTDECLPTRIRFAQLRTLPESGVALSQLVEDYERNLLATALRQTGNSQTKAARLLGVRVQTLNMKLKRLAEQGTPLL